VSDPLIYQIDFYEENGRKPCLEWIRSLGGTKKRALGVAMQKVLQQHGKDVVGEKSWGRQLGDGLFEFRLDRTEEETGDELVLRVFCHAYGAKRILALHGYDKGEDASTRRQNREINEARRRLTAWKEARKREAAAARKAGSKIRPGKRGKR
jgi:phage-related protein